MPKVKETAIPAKTAEELKIESDQRRTARLIKLKRVINDATKHIETLIVVMPKGSTLKIPEGLGDVYKVVADGISADDEIVIDPINGTVRRL